MKHRHEASVNESFSVQNETSHIMNNSLNSSIANLVSEIDNKRDNSYLLFKNLGYDTPLSSLFGSRKNSEVTSA